MEVCQKNSSTPYSKSTKKGSMENIIPYSRVSSPHIVVKTATVFGLFYFFEVGVDHVIIVLFG